MITIIPKISRFLLFLGMANKDDNIGRRAVATSELVETIMHKLGITSPIEEFVELYRNLEEKLRPMVYELGFLK